MVLSERNFEEALRSIRRYGKKEMNYKKLGKALPGDLGLDVTKWAEEGVRESEPVHPLAKQYQFNDGVGQGMQVNTLNIEDTGEGHERREWLFVGMAQANIPEWSRQNVGGLVLKDLADQCNAKWKRYKNGYQCVLSKEHWYTPSPQKKFLNRYYADQQAEVLKRIITQQHPKAVLWVPACPVEEVPSALMNFMYKERFHPSRIIFVSGDRQYPVGKCQYRSNNGRDITFLSGISKKDKLPIPKSFDIHGYKQVKKQLGHTRALRVGVGDHVPDDPFVVFSEKERNFVSEYQFPVIHNALFLFASGLTGKAQETLQKDIDMTRKHMEDVEQSHVTSQYEIDSDDASGHTEVLLQRQRDREALSQLEVRQEETVRKSALGRFMRKRELASKT
eukprot:TRINITY_DN23044_c0_g1_i1.p1 TRINITY_DN23044_c0_g1~~TRINITY_DN23044_c0_g1_i1.p1  ORF type:complete len:391 (+),score=57.50 TRINITY_DN23044_c0_g1_i1:34-1206(+)